MPAQAATTTATPASVDGKSHFFVLFMLSLLEIVSWCLIDYWMARSTAGKAARAVNKAVVQKIPACRAPQRPLPVAA
jgi:NADH:ubiquinone oxidoreductase subunit 5 (subunit L)/multisubunit Na+/H+ antiporter MnhA subunit